MAPQSVPHPVVPSQGESLLVAWQGLISRIDQAAPAEWFAHFTFADNVHPERADKCFRVWRRLVNEEAHGRRFRRHGLGTWTVRATERQQRGVLHYHALLGGGVRQLKRFSWMEQWEEISGGFARIFPYDPSQGGLQYIVKYAVKGGEIDLFLPPRLEQLLRGGLLPQNLRNLRFA